MQGRCLAPTEGPLKKYVWKNPKTPIEALREIIRALPVVGGVVDWRDDITGVVQLPRANSTTTALSEEAISILKSAAGDGRIMHIRMSGGDHLQAGGKQMIPDQETRTVAKWVGGLEDLQRRRFIKDIGHERKVFEVTREGFHELDVINAAKSAT